MTTRYQKRHYEDVARLISGNMDATGLDKQRNGGLTALAHDYADLFAADNPPSSRCWTCGDDKGTTSICTRPDGEHRFGGFDREQFLAACGLESER